MARSFDPISDYIDHCEEQARIDRWREENPIYTCVCCDKPFNDGISVDGDNFREECAKDLNIIAFYAKAAGEDFNLEVVKNMIALAKPIFNDRTP